jgi:hypothetical protein
MGLHTCVYQWRIRLVRTILYIVDLGWSMDSFRSFYCQFDIQMIAWFIYDGLCYGKNMYTELCVPSLTSIARHPNWLAKPRATQSVSVGQDLSLVAVCWGARLRFQWIGFRPELMNTTRKSW